MTLLDTCKELAAGTRKLLGSDRTYCPIGPNSEPQKKFIESDEPILGFLGGTGGGKTIGMLLAACKYLHVPGYRALIIRRTYESLLSPDSPMWVANEWFELTDARPGPRLDGVPRWWSFPTKEGAPSLLRFAHCQHDKDIQRLMGPSWHFIGVEELGEFATRYVWTVITTRQRRPAGSTTPMRKRATGNPGGPGQHWIYEDLVVPGHFIHSTYRDNPAIDREDYGKKLSGMDRVSRQHYEEGDFTARRTGRIYPVTEQHYFHGVSGIGDTWRYVLGVDLGSSASTRTNAFTVMGYSTKVPGQTFMLESYKRAFVSPTEVAEEIEKIRIRYPRLRIVVDPGALGSGWIVEFQSRHKIPCEPIEKPRGYKAAARAFFAGALERMEVLIVADACRDFIEEAEFLCWDEAGMDAAPGLPDHATDSALYAFMDMRHYAARSDPPPLTIAQLLEKEAMDRKKAAALKADKIARGKERKFLHDIRRGRGKLSRGFPFGY